MAWTTFSGSEEERMYEAQRMYEMHRQRMLMEMQANRYQRFIPIDSKEKVLDKEIYYLLS